MSAYFGARNTFWSQRSRWTPAYFGLRNTLFSDIFELLAGTFKTVVVSLAQCWGSLLAAWVQANPKGGIAVLVAEADCRTQNEAVLETAPEDVA